MKVLVLCTGNSARSQMAEAILRYVSKGSIDAHSAGTAPQPEIHPMAREAIRSLFHVEMDGQSAKSVDQFLGQHFDYVITVCDHAADACPVFPGQPKHIHWNFKDPAAVAGTDEERQRVFTTIASELLTRIRLWLALPEVSRLAEGARPEGPERPGGD
jgi:protein-tyrosine-phosphatase